MTNTEKLKCLQHSRDKAQREIDEIERQIADEERPRVGDMVRILPPYDRPWWTSKAVVVSIRDDGRGAWLNFTTGESAWFEWRQMEVTSRATAPKRRRWYNQTEFITFMFAHPVILVRGKDGNHVRSGNPRTGKGDHIFTLLADICESNFLNHEYSLDGKTWQSFGVEE